MLQPHAGYYAQSGNPGSWPQELSRTTSLTIRPMYKKKQSLSSFGHTFLLAALVAELRQRDLHALPAVEC